MNNKNNNQQGHVMIGLLVMVVFIAGMVLWNFSGTPQNVAYAYGIAGPGGTVNGPVGSSGGTGSSGSSSAASVLSRVAGTSASTLRAGGTSGLTNEVSAVVGAISSLNAQGQLSQNRPLATSAIRQLLLALINHAIVLVQNRLLELAGN